MKNTVLLAALCLSLLYTKAQTACDSVSAAFSHTNVGVQYYFFDESVLYNPDSVYWHWEFDDNDNGSELRNPVHYFYYAGDHQVCLTVDQYISGTLCQKTACDTITTDGVTGIGELAEQELLLYPNPTQGICTIKTNYAINDYTIYDALGKKVGEENFHSNTIPLPVSLSAGTYFIYFKTNEGTLVKKLLIQR